MKNSTFSLLVLAIILALSAQRPATAQEPLRLYAANLQTSLLDLEKVNRDLQAKIVYLGNLPRQLEEANREKERLDRKLRVLKNSSERDKRLYQDSLAKKQGEINGLRQLLGSKDKQIKDLTDALYVNGQRWAKTIKSLDSVILINDNLRIYYDAAMHELSGFKYLKLGNCKKGGDFLYQVRENKNLGRYIFDCPKDFPGKCKLECIDFEVDYYVKNGSNSNATHCQLVIYEKYSDNGFKFYASFPVTFNDTPSKYPNYRYFKSGWIGPTEMADPLKSGVEYKFAITEASNADQIFRMTFQEAEANNLLLYTADALIKP